MAILGALLERNFILGALLVPAFHVGAIKRGSVGHYYCPAVKRNALTYFIVQLRRNSFGSPSLINLPPCTLRSDVGIAIF